MNLLVIKNLMIPLVPFLIETLFRVSLLSGRYWWEYFDASTLILTLCLWLLFLLSNVPREPPLPTDSTVKDSLEVVRQTFSVMIIVGFSLFGMIAVGKIGLERLPFQRDQFFEDLFTSLYTTSIFLAIIIILFVYLKSKEIGELLR